MGGPARKVKVVSMTLRPAQVESLKALSDRLYDPDYMRQPSVALLIRTACTLFLSQPEERQRELIQAEERQEAQRDTTDSGQPDRSETE